MEPMRKETACVCVCVERRRRSPFFPISLQCTVYIPAHHAQPINKRRPSRGKKKKGEYNTHPEKKIKRKRDEKTWGVDIMGP